MPTINHPAPADKVMIQHLNKILRNELTAINQYFLHARMLNHQGFRKLGEYEYKESIDEMKHADRIIERVLFLNGIPNLQDLGKLMIGETADEIVKCDLKLEEAAVADLRVAINHAHDTSDFVSENLLQEILTSEEEHIDFIRQQLSIISQAGLQNWLQSWI